MSFRSRLTLATTVVAALLSIPAPRAAAPQPPLSVGQSPLFSSRADLVVLHVSVTDRSGADVSGLPQDAFEVFEDKRPQPIQFFLSQDAPVTVGLLIDSSGSMRPNRDLVIAAATAFAAASNPQDETFACAFNDDVNAVLPATAPFTSDPNVLHRALDRAVIPRGRTALYDALSAGLDYVARGTRERRVLVVVSDGGDNASHATADAILTRTQASDVVVYTVALVDDADREANPRILKRLARVSGGEAFEPRTMRDVADALRQIAVDIRHGYTIGYVATNAHDDGRLRNIRVAVRPPDGRRVVVRTRTGYVALDAPERREP